MFGHVPRGILITGIMETRSIYFYQISNLGVHEFAMDLVDFVLVWEKYDFDENNYNLINM